MNERGRRRNNIWPACKFPFGRKQAASRGGKARREHDENKCVYRDRRRPISAITLCLLYRGTDVSTITDRVNGGRERKRKKREKKEGSKSRIRRDASVARNHLKLLEHFQCGISKVEQICSL